MEAWFEKRDADNGLDSKNHDQTKCSHCEICGQCSGLVVCYFHNPRLGRACHEREISIFGMLNLCYKPTLASTILISEKANFKHSCIHPARWAPTSYKWSYSPYKWPCKWVTGVITPIGGVITQFITGRGPTLWKGSMAINSHLSWFIMAPY